MGGYRGAAAKAIKLMLEDQMEDFLGKLPTVYPHLLSVVGNHVGALPSTRKGRHEINRDAARRLPGNGVPCRETAFPFFDAERCAL
jgi:hypothetical protein